MIWVNPSFESYTQDYWILFLVKVSCVECMMMEIIEHQNVGKLSQATCFLGYQKLAMGRETLQKIY